MNNKQFGFVLTNKKVESEDLLLIKAIDNANSNLG